MGGLGLKKRWGGLCLQLPMLPLRLTLLSRYVLVFFSVSTHFVFRPKFHCSDHMVHLIGY